jgi:hypothetical protein
MAISVYRSSFRSLMTIEKHALQETQARRPEASDPSPIFAVFQAERVSSV